MNFGNDCYDPMMNKLSDNYVSRSKS